MSHRREIYKMVSERWERTPKLKDYFFTTGKINIDTNLPKTSFYQRLGGTVNDTTSKAFMEEIPYAFESFARSYNQLDDLVDEIEATFDRCAFKVDGKEVVWMTRTAPTLVEEVGPETFRSFMMYNVRANLERRR